MTLAPVEEPQVETPEIPESAILPETPEVADADPLAAYEAELGITGEGTPGSLSTPANPEPPNPEVVAEARRLVEQEREKDRQVQQQNGLLADFRDRRNRIQNHLMAVAQGRSQLNIQAILDEFNNQYAQAERVARIIHDAGYADDFYKEADSYIPGISKDRTNHKGTSDRLKAVVEKARDGYVSQKDSEKAVKAARVEEYQKLSKNAAVLRALLSKIEGSAGAIANPTPIISGSFNPETASLKDVNKQLAAMGL